MVPECYLRKYEYDLRYIQTLECSLLSRDTVQFRAVNLMAFQFFLLPTEIRLQILRLLLTHSTPIITRSAFQFSSAIPYSIEPPSQHPSRLEAHLPRRLPHSVQREHLPSTSSDSHSLHLRSRSGAHSPLYCIDTEIASPSPFGLRSILQRRGFAEKL